MVASGLQYGKGENLFHYFFKVDVNVILTQYVYILANLQYHFFVKCLVFKQVSWLMQFSKVPLFGQGTNYIPMIHVNDLGG